MAENETQETTEEVTEAVATQSPATDQGIDDKGEAKTDDSTGAKADEAKADEEAEPEEEEDEEDEEISYHAVEKEGDVTAIWEMQGQKHIRTISPRSTEGLKILNLFTSEIHETDAPSMAESA